MEDGLVLSGGMSYRGCTVTEKMREVRKIILAVVFSHWYELSWQQHDNIHVTAINGAGEGTAASTTVLQIILALWIHGHAGRASNVHPS